jgi:3'-5' exoribonuclease
MKRQYIAGLAVGEQVDTIVAMRAKEMRASRTGEAYLTFEFADRTGRMGGIMFKPDRDAEAVPLGTVVRVYGTVTSYRGILRVSVERLRPTPVHDLRDILPAGPRDEAEMLAELRTAVRSVKDRRLSAVLRAVFGDGAFMERFKLSPASQSRHHAYLGGLLEHTVAVARLCRGLSGLYPHLDVDLLVAGALLHDIGKVDELTFETGIEYTDEGRMLGHVILGERRVREAVDRLGDAVPGDVATRLSHVLLAHHGELEWGSPKRPSTLEALILHHADNLDAKAVGFIEATASAGMVEEAWTDAGNLFRRPLYAPRAAEDERWSPAREDDEYARSA